MKTGTHGSCRLRAEQKGQFNGLRWTRIAYVGRSGFDDSAACRILEKQHQIDARMYWNNETEVEILPFSQYIILIPG
jgi:hypothetical protein